MKLRTLLVILILSASALAHSVTLTWPPVTPTPDGYIVYRASGDGPREKLAELPATNLSFTDKSPADGGKYCYTVRWVARGQSGEVDKPVCLEIPKGK